jgi:hypothetical protein
VRYRTYCGDVAKGRRSFRGNSKYPPAEPGALDCEPLKGSNRPLSRPQNLEPSFSRCADRRADQVTIPATLAPSPTFPDARHTTDIPELHLLFVHRELPLVRLAAHDWKFR